MIRFLIVLPFSLKEQYDHQEVKVEQVPSNQVRLSTETQEYDVHSRLARLVVFQVQQALAYLTYSLVFQAQMDILYWAME